MQIFSFHTKQYSKKNLHNLENEQETFTINFSYLNNLFF